MVPDFFRGDPYVPENTERPIPEWLKSHTPVCCLVTSSFFKNISVVIFGCTLFLIMLIQMRNQIKMIMKK